MLSKGKSLLSSSSNLPSFASVIATFKITTPVTSIDIINELSSEFDHYLIKGSNLINGGNLIHMRFYMDNELKTTSNYNYSYASTSVFSAQTSTQFIISSGATSDSGIGFTADIINANGLGQDITVVARGKTISINAGRYTTADSAKLTGIQIFSTSGEAFSGGEITLFGVNKI